MRAAGRAAEREAEGAFTDRRLLGGGGARHDGAADGRLRGEHQDYDAAGSGYCRADSETEADAMRIGHGYDVHRLVEGRKLILGGVEIPFEKGLDGHSDADVLVHAVMERAAGCGCAGDIGKLFPDNDERYLRRGQCGASQKSARCLAGARMEAPGNLDATVICSETEACAVYRYHAKTNRRRAGNGRGKRQRQGDDRRAPRLYRQRRGNWPRTRCA